MAGSLPFTRSDGVTCFAVPAGAKFTPKTEAIALDESALTGGVLRPALITPPAAMAGAVAEIGNFAVMVNTALPDAPAADAVMVIVPAVLPSVTAALAVPSFNVIAGATVAAPTGLTANVGITPGTPAPVESTIWTISGALSFAPVVPVWLLPPLILIAAGVTIFGVSLRMRSLRESLT